MPDNGFAGVTGKCGSTSDPEGSVGAPVRVILRDFGCRFKIEGYIFIDGINIA
jgi:hypothetical protein